ncbi:PilZ domain protein [Anaerohalosphaera lusitana]|uniref:PilZ domain protein n=2 Tax=Anaerohalosphaera lusitana TaxID=1936003 RepID=A0A1U9NLS2_9BACT|nr:PilZ domain protein [Anaerohalosphaera lusitana]
MEATVIEQRKDTRSQLAWPISVWLPEASRFFNGSSINISKGGAYLEVPMTTPVRPGHEIELNFPRTAALAKQKGSYARIKTGKVVRVDREKMLEEARIGLAVQFL